MNSRARDLLILVLGLGILFVAVSVFSSSAGSDNDPSSTSNGKAGTLALYNWLGQLGFQTSRVEGGFNLDGADTLLMIEPSSYLVQSDVDTVKRFLNRGGDVILSDSGYASTELLSSLEIDSGTDPVDAGMARNTQALDPADHVHQVPMGMSSMVSGNHIVPLLSLGGHTVAGSAAVGQGRIYVITSSLPFSNDGLRKNDSAMFVLDLLERARGGHIAFDEYHHGSDQAAAENFGGGIDQVFSGPLGTGTVLIIAVIALSLAVNGRRLGKPIPSSDPARVPSATERVKALAELFSRAGDRGEITTRYVEELKRAIAALTGVEASRPDHEFIAALPAGPNQATQAIINRGRRLAGSRPSERELLAFAKEVVAVEKQWSEPAAVPS